MADSTAVGVWILPKRSTCGAGSDEQLGQFKYNNLLSWKCTLISYDRNLLPLVKQDQ